MTFVDPAADELLAAALATLALSGGKGPVQSIALRSQDDGPPAVVHVIPIRGAAHDVLRSSRYILIITPLGSGGVLPANLLQGLFDLTPAEAGVAAAVAAGSTVKEITREKGTSLNTVRSQIRAVLLKTGCRRQTELALLLSSLFRPSVDTPPS